MITFNHKKWEGEWVFIREGEFIRINMIITEIISAIIYWYVQYVLKMSFVFKDLNNFRTLSSRESHRIITTVTTVVPQSSIKQSQI